MAIGRNDAAGREAVKENVDARLQSSLNVVRASAIQFEAHKSAPSRQSW
jgi:hypothetical protein